MELNITAYSTNDLTPKDFSASRAEIGDNAGRDTWNAAMEESEDLTLLKTSEEIEALKADVISMGMEEEEIQALSNQETNALFLQVISGDIRECSEYLEQSPIDWEGYEKEENKGGRLYQGIDNEIYYYLGT